MATQFENGLTLSQLAERNAELVTEVEKLRAERNASLNEERVWEKTMMEVCGEDGPASVASEIRSLQALRDTAMQALKSQVEQLAAENVALKSKGKELLGEACAVYSKLNKLIDPSIGDFVDGQTLHEFQFVLDAETPATDRIVAGIKADAITASLDSCSDYLETDCVMDRLDISYEEAEKRTSGAIEFHDAMVDFANQLREGADK